ncbi:MAG: HlyC/CorC family transporter [Desulfobulbaceae bacterium]|nr:HlyC/CorC family transporter [Desulfobulbaceae bacterium]
MDKEEPPSAQTPAPEDDVAGKSLMDKVRTIFGLRGGPDTTEELEQEIQELLEEGEEQGLISVHEEQLITSIFNFRATLTSEIMTPTAEIVAAERNTPIAEIIRLINEEGYTRIPIYKDTLDHVLGVLHAKDLLRICSSGNDQPQDIEEIIKPLPHIAESKPITELLREFQTNKTHMAMVTDEFGGVRGLITLEDIIEEIVGDIDDEYDTEESGVKVVDEHTAIVDAKVDVEYVEQHFGIDLPEGPYESIGGFIILRLGKVPETGAVLQEGLLTFRVLSADARRVKTVRITKE